MVLATDNFYALLIGVGDYDSPDFSNISATIGDAKAVADVLRDPDYCGYPKDNVHTLLGKEADIDAIRKALGDLARGSALAGTIIVYFSGHGGRVFTEGVWQAYLCPRGADANNLEATAISASEFSRALGSISAQRLVVMLDTCFSGGAEMKSQLPDSRWKSGWSDAAYESLGQGSGRVIIASSQEDQVSYIRRENDMSVFTYHLVQALRGAAATNNEGVVYVSEVYRYVYNAVHQEYPAQEPVYKAPHLVGDFPLALAPKRPPAPEPPEPQHQHQENPVTTVNRGPLIGQIDGEGHTINVADRMTVNIDQRKIRRSDD
jgi:hypothetical protein